MEAFVFLVFFLLCIALFLSIFRGRRFRRIKTLRTILILGSIVFYGFYFVRDNVVQYAENLMEVKVINKLPQPLDFHVIRVKREKGKEMEYALKHSGKIRPQHFRSEYLNMDKSAEFWIAGFLGKRELVYFSQHSVPSGNKTQVIEIHNYINQSQKLSSRASKLIEERKLDHISSAVFISLGLLLLFINVILLIRRGL